MYIQQAFKNLHEWWRYLVGFLIIFIASQIGSIPLLIGVVYKVLAEGGDISTIENPDVLMNTLSANLTLFLMLFSFAVGLLALYLIVKYLHNQKFLKLTTTRNKTDWGRVFFGFGLITITTLVVTYLDYNANPDDYEWQFQLVPFIILAVIAIVMIPLQTSFEEYLFRGYLMQGIGVSTFNKKFPFVLIYLFVAAGVYYFLTQYFIVEGTDHLLILILIVMILMFTVNSKYIDSLLKTEAYTKWYRAFTSRATPLIITSVVFGGLHLANPEVDKFGNIIMIYYIGTGFFLGIMTLMDEGMELALGFHAGNNLITAVLVTADWTVFKTPSLLKDISDPTAGFDVLAPVLIIYPIFLLIMAWRYKWTDWGGKLFGRVTQPVEITAEVTTPENI